MRLGNFYIYLILVLISSIKNVGFAQTDNIQIKKFTKNNGLSHNNVYGIVQDAKGFIWVGTLFGLNRFDGTNFKIFLHDSNNPLSICDNSIFNLKDLGNDEIGISTVNGACILNTNTLQFHQLLFKTSDSIHYWSYNVKDIEKDNKGNYAISTGTGFYIFDKDYNYKNRYEPYNTSQILNGVIQFGGYIFKTSNDDLIQWNQPGFTLYNAQKNNFENAQIKYPGFKIIDVSKTNYITLLKNDFVFCNNLALNTFSVINLKTATSIKVDAPKDLINTKRWYSVFTPINDTTLLLNVERGYYKTTYLSTQGKISFSDSLFSPSEHFFRLLIDKNKAIWYGNRDGLFKKGFVGNQVEQYSLNTNADKKNYAISAVCISKNKIYASSQTTLYTLNKSTKTILNKTTFNNPFRQNNYITFIFEKNTDTLWLATEFGFWWYNTQNNNYGKVLDNKKNPILDNNSVKYILKDSKGDFWVTSDDRMLLKIQNNTFKTTSFNTYKNKEILAGFLYASIINEDSKGNIWASADQPIRYNNTSNQIDSIISIMPNQKKFNKGYSVLSDKNDNYWILTNNEGWYKVEPNNKTTLLYNEKLFEGKTCVGQIFNNIIYSYTHNNDIAIINTITNKYAFITKNEGMPETNISTKYFSFDSLEHKIWFASKNNLYSLNEQHFNLTKKTYPFIITQVTIIDDTTFNYPVNTLHLQYFQNNIKLYFNTINFDEYDNVNYYYRLKDVGDTNWIKLSSPEILLTNISPGKYQIEIKNEAKNNKWNGVILTLSLVISPPFYNSLWFYIASILSLVFLSYLFLKWRERNFKALQSEKLKVQELSAEQFKNQLELEKIVNYFSSSLINKNTVDEVLWDVASNLIGQLDFVDCMMYLWNNDKTKMVQKAGYGPKGSIEEIEKNIFDVAPGQGIVGFVMQTKESVLIEDTSKDYRYRVDEMQRLSEITIPIIYNNELIGIIDSEHPDKGFYTEKHVRLMETIATLVATKIKSIESEQNLVKTKIEMFSLNEKLAQTKLEALRSQMNPHFIFNCLNSIKRMILENENESASKYLSKFSQMIRLTLNQSRSETVSIKDNITYLKTYIEMEQLRFEKKFEYSIGVDPNINYEAVAIPSLLIQPMVENAIWHGLLDKEGKKVLDIFFGILNEELFCSVEDNGIGMNESLKYKKTDAQPQSFGIYNIKERLKIISAQYKVKTNFEIISNTQNHPGTYIKITFGNIKDFTEYE